MTIAESIARQLERLEIRVAFGIIGAGNLAIFDAVTRRGYTQIICVHHEQAAVMAANAYFRTSGNLSAAIVTTGAGSSNALTGVMSAYMDSIPVLIIAGNEATTRPYFGRACGVQGYNSVAVAKHMVKWAFRASATNGEFLLHSGASIAIQGRPGPVWLEYPTDVQQATA